MTQIHAEITPGGETIALVAGGGPGDLDLVRAAKLLGTLTPLFTKSDPPGAMMVPASWPAVVQLSSTFGADWRPGPRLCGWIEDQVARRTAPAPIAYTAPEGLTPYPWQSEGAAMIAATRRTLITDEPGTGKTITTILGLAELIDRNALGEPEVYGPILVVCPASVIDAWVEAWGVWAPHVRAVAWRGPVKKRDALAGTADVYVTSYDTARMDAPPSTSRKLAPLLGLGITALVIDECHLIKNKASARSQAVRRLAKRVGRHGAIVALSGTPITHHPGDLWSTLDALEHDAWPSSERWVARYCIALPGEYRDEILGLAPGTEPEFRTAMLGQHRRVAKADVLTQLPPKVYSVRTIDLPTEWRKAYDEFEEQMLVDLPDDGGELQIMDVLAKLNHLSALASAPADVRITLGPDLDEWEQPKRHVHLDLKAPSWKVDALIEILEERRTDDGGKHARCEPVVAFAPSRQLIVLAGAAAEKAGYRVGYVMGGQAAGARTATVAAFQAGQLDLICVTTAAGGVGITLTAARTCVFLQRPWSLVEALQAEDRCHRIGSERHDSIEVIDIVARNTVDTRVRSVLRERAGQLSDLVQDPRVAAALLGGTQHLNPDTERKAS